MRGAEIGLGRDWQMGWGQRPVYRDYRSPMGGHLEAFEPLFCATGSRDESDECGREEHGSRGKGGEGQVSRFALLWRLMTGGEREELNEHRRRLDAHEKRIEVLERRQQANEAFRKVAGEY